LRVLSLSFDAGALHKHSLRSSIFFNNKTLRNSNLLAI